ncbi:uncharacterized protein LOC110856216 [Folsomia candida]|uniref:Outer dense fiber protein 2-like n=1 Tax=Folsomia candida TaxID=158441 RepID=A0A226DQM0_FOLCA|nr:uncharacterized protein LOC110856216 [Folsomia candida]XP_035712833.1 uncharacterized protein LOC110856216 [Folsomia candida]XP_035712834.1 uncharacterized protein LOC110856216 [Folsomia candida]OXA46496.1 Outer dense fiber protein 2-like [Folsomia candida]
MSDNTSRLVQALEMAKIKHNEVIQQQIQIEQKLVLKDNQISHLAQQAVNLEGTLSHRINENKTLQTRNAALQEEVRTLKEEIRRLNEEILCLKDTQKDKQQLIDLYQTQIFDHKAKISELAKNFEIQAKINKAQVFRAMKKFGRSGAVTSFERHLEAGKVVDEMTITFNEMMKKGGDLTNLGEKFVSKFDKNLAKFTPRQENGLRLINARLTDSNKRVELRGVLDSVGNSEFDKIQEDFFRYCEENNGPKLFLEQYPQFYSPNGNARVQNIRKVVESKLVAGEFKRLWGEVTSKTAGWNENRVLFYDMVASERSDYGAGKGFVYRSGANFKSFWARFW